MRVEKIRPLEKVNNNLYKDKKQKDRQDETREDKKQNTFAEILQKKEEEKKQLENRKPIKNSSITEVRDMLISNTNNKTIKKIEEDVKSQEVLKTITTLKKVKNTKQRNDNQEER